ncbi:MAG: polymer-forming cytoskeletal protein [Rhodobacteraceae bacterium]|nr:polymer-forming cytoskeletal protein [Paracoccaceae bacterium]
MDGWASNKAAPTAGLNEQGGKPCVLGVDLKIVGQVRSAGSIKVDGTIIGDIECASLLVTNSASVEGSILAEYVVVHGRVSGSIYADKVMLHAEAQVEGDIFHHGIGIEMGTRYDGMLKWTENPSEHYRNTRPSN